MRNTALTVRKSRVFAPVTARYGLEFRYMKFRIAALFALALSPLTASATNPQVLVEMTNRGASTLYVDVRLVGAGLKQFLVDTGSSYTTINETTLEALVDSEQADYVKDLEGSLADGSTRIVPVYAVRSMNIGGSCMLSDIEVAVFPGDTRNILGLNALRATAPFVFSVEPPALVLSNCSQRTEVAEDLPVEIVTE